MGQKSSKNSCPNHPSQLKKYFCSACKKLYCELCFADHRAHSANLNPFSTQLLEMYDFEQYIGAGANNSFVFKVTSIDDGFPYAVKVIFTDLQTEEEFNVVSKEAQLNAKMIHPNIIKCKNSFSIIKDNLFVFQLELADSSLESEILSKPISPFTAISYFIQIMEGLRYLHEDITVRHHNLTPRNILIKEGLVKISDMTNKMVGRYKRGFGNNLFMSPEVIEGPKYNSKSDIWTAGIVFHYMLSKGRHPFDPKGNWDEGEIVNNIKSRSLKYDESIREPMYLEILESNFLGIIINQ